MNFDSVLTSDHETLNATLSRFQAQCHRNRELSAKLYRRVISLLKKRTDASSDFVSSWLEELRPHSLYD